MIFLVFWFFVLCCSCVSCAEVLNARGFQADVLVLLLLFWVASFKSELYALISEKEKLAKYLRHCHIINWRKRKTGAALLAQLVLAVHVCATVYIYIHVCVCGELLTKVT